MSDLSLDVNFEGSGIEVDAEFGYSNTRYVSPSEYTGELTVVPSHERYILETTGKMLNGNVTIEAAPTSEVIFTENGEYVPPEGEVGFSRVSVDVSGIMDSLLEIVTVVTPTQDTQNLTFPCDDVIPGKYIIASNPQTAFYEEAKRRGVDPNQILGMLK